MSESTNPGTEIGHVAADDADVGGNATMQFSIVAASPPDLIALNATTGVLSLTTLVNYEQTVQVL